MGEKLRDFFKKLSAGEDKPPDVPDDPNISKPMGMVHNFSVTVDKITGRISGLPPAWELWLKTSLLTYAVVQLLFFVGLET